MEVLPIYEKVARFKKNYILVIWTHETSNTALSLRLCLKFMHPHKAIFSGVITILHSYSYSYRKNIATYTANNNSAYVSPLFRINVEALNKSYKATL